LEKISGEGLNSAEGRGRRGGEPLGKTLRDALEKKGESVYTAPFYVRDVEVLPKKKGVRARKPE